jgi:hypothetical protein
MDPLGFDNTFAILVRGADARRLSLKTISDAAGYAPQWRAGFGQDFISRKDGYPGFTRTYGLRFSSPPLEMDLSLSYRALASGQVDLIAGNSTDGLIDKLDLVQLEDDRRYFPPYEAAAVFRRSTIERYPELAAAMKLLAGRITDSEMRKLNYAVDGEKRDIKEVVREFLAGIAVAQGPSELIKVTAVNARQKRGSRDGYSQNREVDIRRSRASLAFHADNRNSSSRQDNRFRVDRLFGHEHAAATGAAHR